jgi:glutamine amidotransferase-like uncharacterized protein
VLLRPLRMLTILVACGCEFVVTAALSVEPPAAADGTRAKPLVEAATVPAKAKSGPIRVLLFDDLGASDNAQVNLSRCLSTTDFTFKRVNGNDIRNGALDEADVLIQPGGSASKQATALGKQGRENVRKFVTHGGGYLGVCAGAYLATTDYEWSLGILDAKVIDREHWARGNGSVDVKLSDAGSTFFDRPTAWVTIYYHQGPLLAPAGRDDVPDYEPLGTFQTEIAKKGAPTGVMRGTTALTQSTYGQGRVICFSPHPEGTPGLDEFIRTAVKWAGRKPAN